MTTHTPGAGRKAVLAASILLALAISAFGGRPVPNRRQDRPPSRVANTPASVPAKSRPGWRRSSASE